MADRHGLIVDYGGVLTTDVFASFRAFCAVEGLAPGATATVILYVPTGVRLNQYWKYSGGAWFNFSWNGTTGARFQDRNGDGTRDVVLTFVDGGRGDDEGLANGVIVDPGAPVQILEVQIDVKPGDETDEVNLASQGRIAVAILGSADFDAALVDVTSVLFAGATAA